MCHLAFNAVRRFGYAVCLLVLLLAPARSVQAQSAPAPDPAGIATGDRTSVGGCRRQSFVVAEPTDKTAPDYAEKKKAFDEYQAQPRRRSRWP